MSDKEKEKKEENSNEELEVVINDDSELTISPVLDLATSLRPKDTEKKDIIVPKNKVVPKKEPDNKEDDKEENKKEDNKENNDNE